MWDKIVESWQYWYWCVIGLACLGLEVALPGVAFLWIAMGAFISCALAFFVPTLTLGIQLIIFSVISIVLVYLSHKYIKKSGINTDRPELSKKAAQYIGNFYDIAEPIVNGVGKIKAGDVLWRVEGEDMPIGTRVIVKSCEGATFKVEKAEDEEEEASSAEKDKETNS
ncbi:MAG: NfeD family protein [Alphaproteobacteria bacterium]|nr:NfeD family protein [Alphaproteobacteria bacterium]